MSTNTSQEYQIVFNDASRDHTTPTLFDNLVLCTVTKPTPGPGEVLVRIRAAGLNPRDILVLSNSPRYPVSTTPGLTPCADGAGEIEAVGEGSKWANQIGQGVLLSTNDSWIDSTDPADYRAEGTLGGGDAQGTLRQYAIVKDDFLVIKPAHLNFEEAASMICASGTAMNALGSIKIEKGMTVLAMGTGGVSCFVIQV
jgi:NADPH:quinone reductase-like Zn-dependent oxidoreductase